jgi:outer membrane protein W
MLDNGCIETSAEGSDMRCTSILAAISMGLGAAAPHGAFAADWASEESQGRIEIRVREVYLYASHPVLDVDGFQYQNPIHGSKFYLEPSVEFFLTPRWSMEIATASRSIQFQDFALQPSLTLTAKYNFALTQHLHPYLGFGWQHSSMHDHIRDLHILIDNRSDGWAAQTGLDVQLSRRWVFNADIRYLGNFKVNRYLGSLAGPFGQYTIDPFLFSLGVAYRFASFR